jgi:hypothetical protein
VPAIHSLKIKFKALPLPGFWIYFRNEYVELSQLVIDILLLFGTTHTCLKKTFSAVTAIKSKCRNRIQFESGLQLLYQRSTPGLVTIMQAHPSH